MADRYTEDAWRLFIEYPLGGEADSPLPDWIPYLPAPVKAKHAVYGDVEFSSESNSRMVDNFKSGVYQKTLPLDAEHQLKAMGAMAWITDMRNNMDGSVDAFVEWTDRGERMIRGGRYRYVSPEFFPQWVDPVTDEVHKYVAIGGAICTKPFLKESYLRPLAATEDGTYFLGDNKSTSDTFIFYVPTEGNSMAEKKTEVIQEVPEQADAVALTELQLKLTELQEALAGESERHAEAEQRVVQLTEALDTSNKRVADMEKDARVKRFTSMIEQGDRWFGETDKHLKILTSFSEAFGEESEEFQGYVTQQEATAKQFKESTLFQELGTSRVPETRTALQEIEVQAKAIQAEKSITYAQAYTEVMTKNPELYERYRKGE